MTRKLKRRSMTHFPMEAVYTPPNNRPYEFFVLDLETSGLDPSIDSVTEVALIHVRQNRIIEEYSSLVRTNKPQSAEVEKLTGITDEMLATAPSLDMVAEKMNSFIGSKPVPIFAHNALFDCRFIFSHGIADAIEASCPICCSLELAQLAFPELESFALKNLAASLELHYPNPHRAVSDAYCTAQLIDVSYTKLEEDKGLVSMKTKQGQLDQLLGYPPCPRCGVTFVAKSGFSKEGHQRLQCMNCGKKYSDGGHERIRAKRKLTAKTTLTQARNLYGDDTLHCQHCSSTALGIKEHRGKAHRFRCRDCHKTMTF